MLFNLAEFVKLRMKFTRKNYSGGKEYDCDDTVMGGVASLKIVGSADGCEKCSWDNVRKHLTSRSYITG